MSAHSLVAWDPNDVELGKVTGWRNTIIVAVLADAYADVMSFGLSCTGDRAAAEAVVARYAALPIDPAFEAILMGWEAST